MRRYISIIIAAVIVIAVLIALSAASFFTLDRPTESESEPLRTTYNSGPTGTRALYQFLEESQLPVVRWRAGYEALAATSHADLMVAIGPFLKDHSPSSREATALRKWISDGGHLLVISRNPNFEFTDPANHVVWTKADQDWTKPADQIADLKSDRFIIQPTLLTRDLKGLQLSTLASRVFVYRPPVVSPSPGASPSPPSNPDDDDSEILWAPVVHMGDETGAVLVDFDYGEGRIVILSDPYVVANNGIGRGDNLHLAMNLLTELRGEGGRILIDETHHGFGESHNQWITYFRGTPAKWFVGQLLAVALIAAYTYGKRFARPLPLPQLDRHSPLEFVGSMANLQKLASARELALENIYPPFRVEVCRTLGVSVRASVDEIVSALGRRQMRTATAMAVGGDELRRVMRTCESAIVGVPIDDRELIELVGSMRKIREAIK
jgi:hypothetical protein